ncbi:PEP-CTERM sorting domain-containing protein [Chamaesiphon sp. VAR_69_metabat_338]|uniref:PEP-CTERM sorting domain-containing protein n=1 Tax=Chamaesiphon sp. VAR_69_metabat_338 TaxID=2964704 RepID=UPI00286E6ECE|nr:PEP-CTERM sorting domain-containing protein [Chamaesiphon sp. VAR_69_metabat_338]
MRFLASTAIACLLLAQSICTKSEAATINLTQGQWDVTGFDIISWNGSKLFFSTQVQNGSDYDITGYFNWSSNGTYRGREDFIGTYTANNLLNFRGTAISSTSIQLANYRAEVLSPSQIGNGTWTATGISGTWSAVNSTNSTSVPEPSSVLGLGIMAVGVVMLKRRIQRKA